VTRPRRENVLFQLFVTGQVAGALLTRAIDASGLTSTEFGVASAIGAFGPITPGELVGRIGMPPTTLSTYLRRFEERGHVRRTRNPEDGRSFLVELTDAGRDAVQLAVPGLRDSLRRIERHLEGPVGDVQLALERLETAMAAALDDSTQS
jgi:DNA-binding MarR family transcriptional regulator